MKNHFSFIIGLLILTSCSNKSLKLIERGDYDRAINLLVDKLEGKKSKSTEKVKSLELAFRKAQEEDLNTEKELQALSSESKWESILNQYQKIENRQNKIKPLLPLKSKENYLARFEFINTLERRKESREKTADYLYQSARKLLQDAKNNKSKSDARLASEILFKLNDLVRDYKDIKSLISESKILGTEHVLISMENNTFKIIPIDLENDLLTMNITDLDSYWRKFDMRRNSNVDYDFHIVMDLKDLSFSPEKEKSRIIEDENEELIKEELKDSKGRVLKDSNGRVIYKETKLIHKSRIEEIVQSKSALLGGKLKWINLSNKNLEDSEPIHVELNFNNRFGRLVEGKRDKLSKANRELLTGGPIAFPSNEVMILDAGDKLKEIIKNYVRKRR